MKVNETLPTDHPYHWLEPASEEDQAFMAEDIIKAFKEVLSNMDPEAVSLTLIELQDAYDVMQSGVLDEAFAEEPDIVPLTPPEQIAGDET